MSANRIDELNAQRFALLHAVWEKTEGDTNEIVETVSIALSLGFDSQLLERIIDYLVAEYLLERPAFGPYVQLTHYGLKEVEEALATPSEPTDHFPSLVVAENYIQIGEMRDSQIQQGSPGASQSQQVDVEALRVLADTVRGAVRSAGLDDDDAAEALSDLDSLDAQLRSPRPKVSVLRESLGSLHRILTGSAAAATLAPEIGHVVEQLAAVLASLPT